MQYGTAQTEPELPGDQGIVQEGFDRFLACKDWQGEEDDRGTSDIKFANADSLNMQQWPGDVLSRRIPSGDSSDRRPCLTVNVVRSHNDLVINEMSKNNFGIKIRPTGGRSSYESAKVMHSIIRRIENISKFTSQRRKVAEHQVDGGIGYILIDTAYVSERSFNQDIFLRAAKDPFAVYLDPWIKEPDGSDANFGFVFEKMNRKTFNRKYPLYKDRIGTAPFAGTMDIWLSAKEVMVVKYYRRKETKDMLISYVSIDENGKTSRVEKLRSEIVDESGSEIFDRLMADIKNGVVDGKTRPVVNRAVEWFLIAGDHIVERGEWAGKYIPICRCVGRETVIDGTLDRKGLTRGMRDAQHILNYSVSADVETGALQTKSPYIAPARALEGQEQWNNLNTENYPVLTYNDLDDEAPEGAQKIDRPTREPPPQPSPAFQASAASAERWMMMISGQWQAQLGENDTQSAASGKAINERQQQSDTATYHFPEHQSDMLRFIGVQLLDLIPKIYDTDRTLHVIDDRGERRWIKVVPDQKDALQQIEERLNEQEAITAAFNPDIGEYECVSDPGPDYATKRQEAFNALTQILAQNKDLVGIIGDELFANSDFPSAEEIRDRLKKFIKATKPYLFDDTQDPQMLQLQQQIAGLTKLNTELMQKLADMQLRLRGRDEKRDIEAFNADTKRIDSDISRVKIMLDYFAKTVLSEQQKAHLDQELMLSGAQMDHDLTSMGHQHMYDIIAQANAAELTPASDGTS
jgi:hypothetical protein